jgi:hypothetical protein
MKSAIFGLLLLASANSFAAGPSICILVVSDIRSDKSYLSCDGKTKELEVRGDDDVLAKESLALKDLYAKGYRIITESKLGDLDRYTLSNQ